MTGTSDQPSGKMVVENGAGHARETNSTESEQTESDTEVFCLVNRVSLKYTLDFGDKCKIG